ncbi:MAG: CAP domain-containing protein [Candidatus Shapirobacteria bacterium]
MKYFWSNFFIPQEKNNHRASILKPYFLFLLVGFYLFNQSVIKFVSLAKPGILGYSSEITAQKVLDQTNIERQKNGLEPLQYNSVLSESATQKAQDMFANNYWAHTSPTGTPPWNFFKNVNYKYSVAGENLARDFYDTDSLIKAWMNSPTHRDNLLNNKYQEIGIGVVNGILGGVKTTLVVQHFATPLNTIATKTNLTPITPIPQSISETNNAQILSESQTKYLSPLLLSKIIGLIIFSLIIVVLFIDGFITFKKNIHRMTGSSIGHIGFLLVILLFMLYTQQGAIF